MKRLEGRDLLAGSGGREGAPTLNPTVTPQGYTVSVMGLGTDSGGLEDLAPV